MLDPKGHWSHDDSGIRIKNVTIWCFSVLQDSIVKLGMAHFVNQECWRQIYHWEIRNLVYPDKTEACISARTVLILSTNLSLCCATELSVISDIFPENLKFWILGHHKVEFCHCWAEWQVTYLVLSTQLVLVTSCSMYNCLSFKITSFSNLFCVPQFKIGLDEQEMQCIILERLFQHLARKQSRLLKHPLHNDRWTRNLNWNQWTDLFTILATCNRKASEWLPDKSFMPYKCIYITLCWYINAWALNLVWCHYSSVLWSSMLLQLRWDRANAIDQARMNGTAYF